MGVLQNFLLWQKRGKLFYFFIFLKQFGPDAVLQSSLDSSLVKNMQSDEQHTNMKDRGNSCVVMDKRLLMTRHVGDHVSIAT